MMNEVLEIDNVATEQTMVKMVFDSWYTLVKHIDDVIDAVSDEQLEREIAPGRNKGTYVLGHLIAVNDDMFPLLGFGDKLYPEINEVFKAPPSPAAEMLSTTELKARWKNINAVLKQNFDNLQPEQWFQKHNSVSAEDFSRQPHRNKLNVMISRTCHLAHHFGQLNLLT
jgi:hypothetical protein